MRLRLGQDKHPAVGEQMRNGRGSSSVSYLRLKVVDKDGRSIHRVVVIRSGVGYFAIAFSYAAYYVEFFAGSVEHGLSPPKFFRWDGGYKSYTQVEGAEHFLFGDVADLLHVFKDGQDGPAT